MMTGLRHDYSWSESLLAFWATLTLGIVAVTSLGLRYVTPPMTCFLPPEMTGFQGRYVQEVCFHSKNVFIPTGDAGFDEWDWSPSTYHQWVPFFLGVASLLCLLPHALWRMLTCLFWLDAHALVQALADNHKEGGAGRHVKRRDHAPLLKVGFNGSNYVLSAAALGRKGFVVLVCGVQVMLMWWVFLPQLTPGGGGGGGNNTIQLSLVMPLPVELFYCRFPVRQLDRVHLFSVMCFMPLAQVYSKGLAFLFYFFLVLFLLSGLDLLLWAGRLLMPGLRDVSLQRYLSLIRTSPQDPSTAHFLQSLGVDGRLVVALTADRCGPLAAAELTDQLWQTFKGMPRPRPAPDADGGPAPVSASHAPTPSAPALASGTSDSGAGSDGNAGVAMVTICSVDRGDTTKEPEKGQSC